MDYTSSDPLLDTNGVCAANGGKSKMTLHRWRNDPRVNFPPPDIEINGRNYWYQSTVRRWQAAMAEKTPKPNHVPHPEHATA